MTYRGTTQPRMLCLIAVLTVVVTIALQPGSLAADQPDIASIMQKYADALGGHDVLGRIQTAKSVYQSTLMGRTITVTSLSKAPVKFVQRIQAEGMNAAVVIGFDGKTAWTQTLSGEVVKLTGTNRADVISESAGTNNSEIIRERWPTQLSLKPNETVDGKQYYVVAVRPQGGSERDLLLDTQSFLPVIMRQYATSGTTLSIATKFGKGPLGEATAAVSRSIGSAGPVPDLTFTLVSTEDNIRIDDSAFAPPVPTNAPTTTT